MKVETHYSKKETTLSFRQRDASIYSTHLTLEQPDGSYVKVYMSVEDAIHFMEEFKKKFYEYKDKHYWWKTQFNEEEDKC